MKEYKIKTPNANYTGKQHGVRFYHGEAIAELTEPVKTEFISWGYTVEEVRKGAKETAPKTKKNER